MQKHIYIYIYNIHILQQYVELELKEVCANSTCTIVLPGAPGLLDTCAKTEQCMCKNRTVCKNRRCVVCYLGLHINYTLGVLKQHTWDESVTTCVPVEQ